MPIKGMTDSSSVVPRFPRLGKLRKGSERVKKVNKAGREVLMLGKDLDHFRFVPERDDSNLKAIFYTAFGQSPRVIQVYLPYRTPAENFPTWCEIWDASGLVHRCDGETMTLWREGKKLVSGQKPCAGGHKDGDYRNDAVGRLSVIIPELIEAGHVGYVVLETHGKNDCANITSVLMAVYDSTPRQDLRGIAFNLRRSLENISVPGWGDRSEQRSRADKWLVRIEPVADWTRLALEASKRAAWQLEAPRGDVGEERKAEETEEGDFERVEEDTDFSEPHAEAEEEEGEEGEEAPEPATSPAMTAVFESPDAIRVKVAGLVGARQGQEANEKQRGLAIRMLEACFNADDAGLKTEMRHRTFKYLFGHGSSKDLQGPHHLAVLDWLRPELVDGKYKPSEGGILEARIVEHAALLAEGQMEFPPDLLVEAAKALRGVVVES